MDQSTSSIPHPVRQYSLRMEQEAPNDILVKSLADEIKSQDAQLCDSLATRVEWNRWLEFGEDESDQTIRPLQDKRKELAEIWVKFDGSISHALGEDTTASAHSQVPTVTDLYSAIVTAQMTRDSQKKRMSKRTKNYFLQFCETMNDHAFLFKFVPAGDKYISLISGVVTSIVKASVNHNKIEEAFSLALWELSQDLRLVKKKTANFDSLSMRRLVVEFYTQVFSFLCLAMSWYTSRRKRLKAAINTHFYDRVLKTQVDSMQKTVSRIKDEAENITQTMVIDINEGIGALLALQGAGNASRFDSKNQSLDRFGRVGERLLQTLVGVEKDDVHKESLVSKPDYVKISVQEPSSNDAADIQDEADIETEMADDDVICTRAQVKQLLLGLENLHGDGRAYLSNVLRGEAQGNLPDEVLLEFTKWITAAESKTMWVAGDGSSSSHGSDLSLAAMRICDIGIEEGIACLSFFVQPRYDFATKVSPVLSQREAATVALLYSITCQLSMLLPPEFAPTAELNAENFQLLDRSIESVGLALRIIKALIANAPPVLLCIIDGFDLAETRTTRPHLSSLMAMFREEQKKRIFKVCITTEANSMVLATSTGIRERVDASYMEQESSQRTLRGASSINELRRSGVSNLNTWKK